MGRTMVEMSKKWPGFPGTEHILLTIYMDHKKRLNVAFWATICCGCLAIGLLFWIIWVHDRTDFSVKLLMPLIPFFLSGTLFWIYRLESKKMDSIEKEIWKDCRA